MKAAAAITDKRPPWALVLAGGDGRRLQSLTQRIAGAPIPKQYCRLLGERSLLEATVARVASLAPIEQVAVVINHDHLPLGRPQLTRISADNLIVQPCNRDTGPGILLALLHLAARDPEATVAVFPSDHYVGDEALFMDAVRRAVAVVELAPQRVALLGIRPEHPDTGFGYLVPGAPLTSACGEARRVARFAEKPGADEAARLVANGALWNSFVMVFRVRRMLDLVAALLPADHAALARVYRDPSATEQCYRDLRPWNFSHDVLTHITEHLALVAVDGCGWSDWGTPEAIERTVRHFDRPPAWYVGEARA